MHNALLTDTQCHTTLSLQTRNTITSNSRQRATYSLNTDMKEHDCSVDQPLIIELHPHAANTDFICPNDTDYEQQPHTHLVSDRTTQNQRITQPHPNVICSTLQCSTLKISEPINTIFHKLWQDLKQHMLQINKLRAASSFIVQQKVLNKLHSTENYNTQQFAQWIDYQKEIQTPDDCFYNGNFDCDFNN